MPHFDDLPHPDQTPGDPVAGDEVVHDRPTADDPTDPSAAERRRVEAVRATGLVGVDAGERLDRIARRAAKIAGAPMALVSLVGGETQWCPGLYGEGAPRELPREASFCSVAIDTSAPLVVADATEDPRFAQTAGVVGEPHIRFYAGHPIDDGDGNLLGAVCVLDVVPRETGAELMSALADLAVWARHELIPAGQDGGAAPDADAEASATAAADADERLQELERLQALVVSTTAHELRTPLTVLRVHAELLRAAGDGLGPDERASLEAITRAVQRLELVSDDLVADLRSSAGGAEEALRRWLQLDPGSERVRPDGRI